MKSSASYNVSSLRRGKKRTFAHHLPPLTTSVLIVVEVVYRMELLLQTCGDEQLKMQLEQVIPMLDEHLIGAQSISDGGKAVTRQRGAFRRNQQLL